MRAPSHRDRRHSRARRLVVARDSRELIDERRHARHEFNHPAFVAVSRVARRSSVERASMSAKELSALTGHGVDDCKTVLAECGGDVERAVDTLLNSA